MLRVIRPACRDISGRRSWRHLQDVPFAVNDGRESKQAASITIARGDLRVKGEDGNCK